MLCHFLNRGITPDKVINLPYGEKLFYNNNAKAARTALRAKCPSCGAPVDYFSDEANPTCPYCGMPIDVKTDK